MGRKGPGAAAAAVLTPDWVTRRCWAVGLGYKAEAARLPRTPDRARGQRSAERSLCRLCLVGVVVVVPGTLIRPRQQDVQGTRCAASHLLKKVLFISEHLVMVSLARRRADALRFVSEAGGRIWL